MSDDEANMMSADSASQESVRSAINAVFSAAQAALVVRLNSIERAEDAMQDAVVKALQHWVRQGIPQQPLAWLVTTAMNSFRDQYRRESRVTYTAPDLLDTLEREGLEANSVEPTETNSDEDILRLIFMCCHPGIAVENQLALSLRMLMGFSFAEIAKALLVSQNTIEQRIGRAKRKITSSGISLGLPRSSSLSLRLASVRQILYLIFNEGYHCVGEQLLNRELCRQAIQLARALCRRFPDAENFGLLSLMLFHDARASARLSESGELITLDVQDRMLWKRGQISEADVLLQKALRTGNAECYQLQAAIAGLHSLAESADQTDWIQIAGLYRKLLQRQSNPVVWLNYAVALMMAGKLADAEQILNRVESELKNYSPYYAAKAKFCTLSGRRSGAKIALMKAAAITGSATEKRHYQLQLDAVEENMTQHCL